MSQQQRNPNMTSVSGTVLIVTIAAVTCFIVAAVVVLAVAVPEGGNAGSLIALLVATLAPTIASLVNIAKTDAVATQTDATARNVHSLANGLMDAKIRSNVADVIGDQHTDPAMAGQIANDRLRRDAQHVAGAVVDQAPEPPA